MQETEPSDIPDADDPISHTQELPVVELGLENQEEVASPPRVRLLPGKVHLSWVLYPMYLFVIISGGLAANVALDTDEWPFGIVVITWFTIYVWIWMYGIAWSYRRRLFEATCIFMTLAMEIGVALLCWDRAAPQFAATRDLTMLERPEIPALQQAASLLLLCALGLVAHVVFLGRGYRKKRED